MLTSEERADVQHELARVLQPKANPRAHIQVIFSDPADSEAILGAPTWAVDPNTLASLVLHHCLRIGWTRDPAESPLQVLLEYLITRELVVRFERILKRVQDHIDPNPSAYDASWLLDNSRPFFDRQDLRMKVRMLIEQSGRTILRVPNDDRGYGRSYTLDFLAHVANCRPAEVRVVAAVVPDKGGPSYKVDDLLAEVGDQLGTADPLPDQTRSSYADSAARWLRRNLKNAGCLCVLVLDGFGQEGFDSTVDETIQKLAQSLTVPEFRRWIRLVLLGYPHPLPREVGHANVLTEVLRPAVSISQGDLLPCLEAWDALRKKEGLVGVADGQLPELADGMLAKAPPEGKERLAELHASLLYLLDMAGDGTYGTSF